MTIHVFGDDRLPAGLPYDGQRSFAPFFALKRMSIWIFSEDDSCVHKQLASYGFAIRRPAFRLDFSFSFSESVEVGCQPTKVSCIHKRL
jgi:hypothetical protein